MLFGCFSGPEDTPYAGGVFHLWCRFGEEYPASAPEVRFRTAIHHCNINSTGKVCHSVFDRNWTTDMSMRQVFDCVYGLLLAPEPDDPLDSVLAAQYYEDRAAYDAAAQQVTRQYAKQSVAELRNRLLDEEAEMEESEHPKHLICPLTLEACVCNRLRKRGRWPPSSPQRSATALAPPHSTVPARFHAAVVQRPREHQVRPLVRAASHH